MINLKVVVKFNHWKSGEKGIEIILNSISLKDESEIEHSLRSGLVRQNCSWSDWCGSGSINVHFDINLATSVTAVRG